MSEKIRLMIVDDEQAFIELIKNITDWTEHQIEMCRPANNGKKALELIETEKPDVVLTDIKMPVMDGIEFARQISARKCEINVVVMSGYDEFEIVKEAFKLGVKDYVLKSEIDVEELVRTIQKAAQSTKDTRMIDERSMVLHDNLHLYTDDIRLRQIKRIIEGNVMFDGGEMSRCSAAKLGFNNKNVFCMSFFLNDFKRIQNELSMEDRLIQYAVMNVLYEFKEEGVWIDVLPESAALYTIIVCLREKKEFQQRAEAIFSKLCKMINTVLKTENSGGISELKTRLDGSRELDELRRHAICAKNMFFIRGSGQLYCYGKDMQAGDGGAAEIGNIQLLKQFLAEDRIISGDRFWNGILVDKSKVRYADIESIKQLYYIYYCAIADSAVEKGSSTELRDEIYAFESYIREYKDLDSYNQWLQDIVKKLVEMMKGKTDLVERVKHYIHVNYSKNIALTDIANSLSISSSYLSRMFNKKTGMSISRYILVVRVKNAKMLLRSTNLKIYEIAERVGFENIEYFSRSFKKETKKTPKQYANEFRER